MNLINDPWIPILRRDGKHDLIAPWQLTELENPVIALDAPRPDFNGALMQFLIGLLQTTATPENHDKWLDWLEQPPTPDMLKECFSQYAHAFELNSDQGSFMQDFDSLDESDTSSIAELLIESPGGNTVKENKDHFIKRGQIDALCPACAATALFTLQTNAPSGGQGHRTSIRGGGPLSTLLIWDQLSDLPHDLWRNLWLNILEQTQLDSLSGDKERHSPSDIFPWLAKTRTSEKECGKETTPLDANPLQMYWGMPRRIRILWESGKTGGCDVCGTSSENVVSSHKAKNYGINYAGAWQHPLSPYSQNTNNELLPQHAQPGGVTYQHWLGLIENTENRFCALVVKRFQQLAWEEQLRLYVFGYDMDNMKARCWYETTFPLFTIPVAIRIDFTKRIQVMTEAASEFAGFVRTCVKEAWFKRPGDAKGDTSFLTQSFYQHTSDEFFTAAKLLQTKIPDGGDKDVLHAWHKALLNAALYLFDYWAARGDVAQASPRRIAQARDKLKKLAWSKKIKDALQLPVKEMKPKKSEKEAV